jgi:nuclear pore complex protein Nup155
LQLAKSDFPINLSTRIGYLSRAKANASTRTNGLQDFSRSKQSKQEVVREINDLLDLANIQEDLLHRLTKDARVTADRKPDIVKELDGQILPLDTVSLKERLSFVVHTNSNQLYNSYADQASYYDLCLIIYELADYRNSADIRATWVNLIHSLEVEATKTQQAQAFELVAEKFRDMGKRLNCSETTFPIRKFSFITA